MVINVISIAYVVVICTGLTTPSCEPVLIFDDYPSCNARAVDNNMRLAASGISSFTRRESGNPHWICHARAVRG